MNNNKKIYIGKFLIELKISLISNPNRPKVISEYAVFMLDCDVSDNGIRYLNWLRVLVPDNISVVRAFLCAIHSRRGQKAAMAVAHCFKKGGSEKKATDSFLRESVQIERAGFQFSPPTLQSPFDLPGQWRRVPGSDDFIAQQGGARSLRALEVHNRELYGGFSDNQAAKHFVGKWDGERWSLIADEHTWRGLGFDDANSIASLCSANGKLYATISVQKIGPLRGEVFSYDGKLWENISQGLRKWTQLGERALNAMIFHEDRLYVGSYVGRSRQEPLAVYCFDGDTWEREVLRASSLDWEFTGSEIYEFTQYNGMLYAATSGFSSGSGTIWRLAASGWELVGGGGLRNSWGLNATQYIEALAVYQGKLIVSFGPANQDFRLVEILPAIWMFDGDWWEPLVAREDLGVMVRSMNYNHLFVRNERLLAATGCTKPVSFPAEVAIWELDVERREWKRRAGSGIGGSWSRNSLDSQNDRNLVWIYRMIEYQDDLYASISFGNGGGQAELWYYGRS
jgi:hypothetical protein